MHERVRDERMCHIMSRGWGPRVGWTLMTDRVRTGLVMIRLIDSSSPTSDPLWPPAWVERYPREETELLRRMEGQGFLGG